MTNIEIAQPIKVQFKVSHSADAMALSETMEQYRQACQKVSQYVFDHAFELRLLKLHQELYYFLRGTFGLRSQMALSVNHPHVTTLVGAEKRLHYCHSLA